MIIPKNLSKILMAVWFIAYGILSAPFLRLSFAYSADLLALLAIAVGALILWRRD